jgi:hypothetical protein
MEPVSPTPVLARWDVRGDPPSTEHMARVALRHLRQARSGSISPGLALGLCFAIAVLLSLLVSPLMLVGVLCITAAIAGTVVFGPRNLVKAWRQQASFHEPYTVTLDAEGLHAVGPSVADHLRWRVFDAAAVDEDVLVLTPQGTKMVRVFPLETLDPRIDREWLAHEIGQLIAADAAHAVYSPR